MNMLPNFIIGGTNKAGTTSVFEYLIAHPEVCGSRVKETGFFIDGFSGDEAVDRARLGSYFAHAGSDVPVRVEASTAYLGCAHTVAPRARQLLGDPRWLFILRNPADRLYSYYHFHVGALGLPPSLPFAEYVALCRTRAAQGRVPAAFGAIEDRHFMALERGCYGRYLQPYLAQFGAERVCVMFYDDLRADLPGFMRAVCQFAGIDAGFYDHYAFHRANATFTAKHHSLHRAAIFLNRKLERVLRGNARVKRGLVSAYKRINLDHEGYAPMSASTREDIDRYYAPDVARLQELLGRPVPWPEYTARHADSPPAPPAAAHHPSPTS